MAEQQRAWQVKGLPHVAFAHDGDRAPSLLTELLDLPCVHLEFTDGFVERMLPVGNAYLQLLEATGPGIIKRFTERRGAALHHVALEVSDLDEAVSDLRGRGARMVGEAPRPGGMGTRIAFVHPASCDGLLLELVEPSPAGLTGTRDPMAGRS
jgi:methylmalonyl-CoA/ethylmalonyl-CoA epimerase